MTDPESKEMYLETIYLLHRRGARVKSTDVASELGFSRPSVSNAVKRLQAEGLVTVDKSGELILTQEGQKRAESTYERHCVFTELLVMAGADERLAEQNACKMEHVVTDELFDVLRNYRNKIKRRETK